MEASVSVRPPMELIRLELESVVRLGVSNVPILEPPVTNAMTLTQATKSRKREMVLVGVPTGT
jgi:hypothetical protein